MDNATRVAAALAVLREIEEQIVRDSLGNRNWKELNGEERDTFLANVKARIANVVQLYGVVLNGPP